MNGYPYASNSPVLLVDPSGFEAYKSCCGPDVTDWFAEELKIHHDWIQAEKSVFDAETMRMHDECLRMSPAPQNCWGLSLSRSVQWLLTMYYDYAKAIPYKWMSFRYLVPDCPSGDCWFTVTLCDTCLERSALGNIMAGFTAKLWGWNEWAAREGFEYAVGGAEGALGWNDEWPEWDAAATGIGNYLADNGAPPSPEMMCSSMKAIDKCSSERKELYPEACWDNMQAPCAEKCVPCKTSVPLSTPHTIPAFADDPAGHSPFAGAPKYGYYTDQIPEGMLDLLLKNPRRLRDPYLP